MKKIALIVLSAVILFAAPSCKKQQCKLVKHVVSEEYVYADPCGDGADIKVDLKADKAKKEAKLPTLWRCQAKYLVKGLLKDEKIIKTPRVVPLTVGYYECNEACKRELLYKAQVNGLIDADYTDIVNHDNLLTYWVEAALTPKGKALIIEDETPIFPEDTITEWGVLFPESGKNKYGEYTCDSVNLSCDVTELIQKFYRTYIANKNEAILAFGTNDLIAAQERILKAKDLGVRKRVIDPFTRNYNFDLADVEALAIYKWTCYVDLYVVRIDGQQFCIVVKDQDGVKKIDDVALNTPAMLNIDNTMRYFALNITARELHDAQKYADINPSRPDQVAPVAPSVKNAPATPLLFDEYAPVLMPGIEKVVRPTTIPYDLAVASQYAESFNLLAFDKKFAKMGKLKTVKGAAVPTKKANIVIKTVKVSPLGRICYKAVEGATEEYVAFFQYLDEEWMCVGIREAKEVKVEIVEPFVIAPRATQATEIVPSVTEQLNDVQHCECAVK